MRCFDYTSDECCSFYDPHDNDKCLNECPPDRLITENFDCAGILNSVSISVLLSIHGSVLVICDIFLNYLKQLSESPFN